MGIINLTPDSFFDGGYSLNSLETHINNMNTAHVDMIDIGAESSRPGAKPISFNEEINRLKQGLSTIQKKSNALISVDTYKPETALFALQQGVEMINDISGGESSELLDHVAKHNAGIILMHKQGDTQSMQNNPQYTEPVTEIISYLKTQIQKAKSAGIQHIMIDPGIGFGKTLKHNLAILKNLNEFQSLGCPIVLGTSNKSFIGQLTGAELQDRLGGSLASILAGYQKGATIFRVHDVIQTKQAFDVFKAMT